MPNSAAAVAVGKPKATGGAYRGPAGTTLPTGVDDTLPAGMKSVGYVSSDGVVQTISADSNEVVAWGGDTVRKIQTTHDVSYKLTMIETNDVSQAVYYGDDNVTLTDATTTTGKLTEIKLNSDELPRGVWAFELKDGDRIGRIVLPDAQVSGRDDVSYVDDDAVSYPITLTAYPDSSGTKSYIYWDEGVFSAS